MPRTKQTARKAYSDLHSRRRLVPATAAARTSSVLYKNTSSSSSSAKSDQGESAAATSAPKKRNKIMETSSRQPAKLAKVTETEANGETPATTEMQPPALKNVKRPPRPRKNPKT